MAGAEIPNAELARISGAFVDAITEARAMADAGQFGPEFADLLRHARELHELILEELAAAYNAAGEYARGLAWMMGDKLKELDALLPDGASSE